MPNIITTVAGSMALIHEPIHEEWDSDPFRKKSEQAPRNEDPESGTPRDFIQKTLIKNR